ncbi:MAG: hypothetical protein ACMX3H_10425 [Sodalis sp. (in: enterobacteria)]|uniref:hypothetical protein n=1 Tax=Sodalis sp. (in: enterobacteria) TaxID=1898979 RepID=UPI0039E5E34C
MSKLYNLIFESNKSTPEKVDGRGYYLVIHAGDGYCLAQACYDENDEFICFIVDSTDDAPEDIYPGEYLSWARLPAERKLILAA